MSIDSDNTLASLTTERITELLVDAGHADAGGAFTDDTGVAWLLRCRVRTVRSWREKGCGPPAKLIGSWLYPIDELSDWLQSRPSAGETRQHKT